MKNATRIFVILCAGLLFATPIFADGGGSWLLTGPMGETHNGHTATLLNTGKVLAVGGEIFLYGFDLCCSGNEIFDPQTNVWANAAGLNSSRSYHTANLLPDGRVFVVGGYQPGYKTASIVLSSTEAYDPNANVWTELAPLSAPRTNHTATFLDDGRIFVAGGRSQNPVYYNEFPVTTTEMYSVAANSWSVAAPMTISREKHTATRLPSGKILVVGGSLITTTAEVYDPATNTWQVTSPMNQLRLGPTATLLPDGRVLVAGGVFRNDSGYLTSLASVEVYDPATNAWTLVAPMNMARYLHTATLLPNGTVLVISGSSPEVYDPAANTWQYIRPMAFSRYLHTATLLPNGKTLVTGGAFLTSWFVGNPNAEIYNPAGSALFLPVLVKSAGE
jgi:N-acetylneuraminic acid mutarotase